MTRSNVFLLVLGALAGFGVASFSAWSAPAPIVENRMPLAQPELTEPEMLPAIGKGEYEAPSSLQTPTVMMLSGAIADIAAQVTPSVVTIRAKKIVNRANMPEWLKPFYEGSPGGPELPHGTGSGVIVRSDGIILTNNHVVAGSSSVEVILADGRELMGTVVGADPKSDIAVVKVETDGLPAIHVGDPDRLRVGELVLAVGNPFGVGQTVTMGIVSAKGRADLGLADYENFIQTDAAINPGNSGGALINAAGNLVGINTAIVSRSGGYQGIGFAIPVDMAMSISGQLLADGKVQRGKLGVRIETLDRDTAISMGLEPDTRGVLVRAVERGSAAGDAGIKPGDVVVRVGEQQTDTISQLRNEIAGRMPDEQVQVELLRDTGLFTVDVRLGSLDDQIDPENFEEQNDDSGLGFEVGALNDKARSANRLGRAEGGVVIMSVEPGSAADLAGIKPGQIVTEVNRSPVASIEEFHQLARSSQGRIALKLLDRGQRWFVMIDPS